MGHQSTIKDLRKQLRNIAIELLPQITATEAFRALQEENHKRLDLITEEVRSTLLQMEARQKDVQNFLIRQVTANQTVGEAPKSE